VATVDTIEIEPIMARAARVGFMPRVRNTFEDSRSHLHFEDAKTFFAAHKQRYDVIVSEPSNPWVSGVASLFSTEFYRQLAGYLQPDGLLVQWLQIYETDTDTLTSVLRALAPQFADFALYSTDNANILIVATRQGPVPEPQARIFGFPALREELSRVQLDSMRDINARFIGNRDVLLPMLALSTVPANSDYFPYVDLHAIRARILRRNAREVTDLAVDPTAMLDLLLRHPAPALAPVVRSDGLSEFDRIALQATALANAVIDSRLDQLAPDGLRDVTLLSVSAAQCQRPELQRAWMESVFRIARVTTPTLGADQLKSLWQVIQQKPCATRLEGDAAIWLDLLRAVAMRQQSQVADQGKRLIGGAFVFDSQAQLAYAVQSTIGAVLAGNDVETARSLLAQYAGDMAASGTSKWVLDILAGLSGVVVAEVH
jgi:hypothetical protein